MEVLEKKLRENIVKTLYIPAIVEMVVHVVLMIESLLSNCLSLPLPIYILKRICLPFSINIGAFIVAKIVVKSQKISVDTKNMVCSIAFCTIAGATSIFNSHYVELWVAPSLAIMFCSVFHNKKINIVVLIYSCSIVFISALYANIMGTETFRVYMRKCLIIEALTILIGIVAWYVQNYQKSIQELILKSLENEEKYRQRLEYDVLTKVHSRGYINEVSNNLFDAKSESRSIGVAMIDLDNFKSVNDTYGHDNGDEVLRSLGRLLNEYANEDVIVGRFGGEEFIIVFKGEDKDKYYAVLDEIRDRFSKIKFDFMERNLSFSSGLVKCTSNVSYQKVFKEADKALYISKNTGKNKITEKYINGQ